MKRGRGRPPGSKNAPRVSAPAEAPRPMPNGLFTAEQTAQIARDAVSRALAALGVTNLPSDAPIAVNDKVSKASRMMVAQRKAEKEAPRAPRAVATVAVPVAVAQAARRRGRPPNAVPLVAPTPIDDRPDTLRRRGQSLNMFGSQISTPESAPAPLRH